MMPRKSCKTQNDIKTKSKTEIKKNTCGFQISTCVSHFNGEENIRDSLQEHLSKLDEKL